MKIGDRQRLRSLGVRGRVEALAALGRWPEALEEAERGLGEDPQDFDLVTWVVRARLRLGDSAGALREARRLVLEAPDDEWSYRLLSWSLYQQDDPQALNAAWRAASLSPEEPEPLYTLGIMQLDQHLTAEAEDTVERLLAVAPELAASHELLCRVRLGQSRFPDAEVAAREALKLDPLDLDHHVLLAESVSRQARTGEAFEILARARTLQPADFKPKRQAQSVASGFLEGAGLVAILLLAGGLFGSLALVEEGKALGAVALFCVAAAAVGGATLAIVFRRRLGRPSPAARLLLKEVAAGARSQVAGKVLEVSSAASTATTLILGAALTRGRLPDWLPPALAVAALATSGVVALAAGGLLLRSRGSWGKK